MTKREKRIVITAILLVITAFALNRFGTTYCNAETMTTAIPSPTSRTVWTDGDSRKVEKTAWELLREEYSETATAAILGNLKYESGGCPFRYEGLSYEESYKLNQRWRNNESKFVNSNYGYGLAGWTGTYNLQKLWDWCEENGYDIDSVEGQIKFLMFDYVNTAPMSYRRMAYYNLEDIVTATEDFRQSYEKSVSTEYGQYKRAKWAKSVFAGHCEDILDILKLDEIPYHFDIFTKVQELNERIETAS